VALIRCDRPKIFHNMKADITFLLRAGLHVKGPFEDTSIMHAILDPDDINRHALKPTSRRLLGKDRVDEIRLEQEQKKYPRDLCNLCVPQELLHHYAREDAVDTLLLYKVLSRELEQRGQWDLYRACLQAEEAYWKVSERGFLIDLKTLEETLRGTAPVLHQLEERMFAAFGARFNPSSPKQLSEVLGPKLGLVEKTPSGVFSTDLEVLSHYKEHPGVQALLAWKFLIKACRMLESYKKEVDNQGRVHPRYFQLTKTGRSQCTVVNLQNIPKARTYPFELELMCGSKEIAEVCADVFAKVRAVFIAAPGAWLVSQDYSQIEYRMAAHFMGNQQIIDSLRAGEDFHKVICEMVFGEYRKELRVPIKKLNYGRLYGMGNSLMAELLSAFDPKPWNIIKQYDAKCPWMMQFRHKAEQIAATRGYVKDMFGRRYFYDKQAPYKIVAYLCQGAAANVKKIALGRIHKLLMGIQEELTMPPQYRTGIVADIHDDIVLEYYPEDRHLIPEIHRIMKDFPQVKVPLEVDISVGKSLYGMKEVSLEDVMKLE